MPETMFINGTMVKASGSFTPAAASYTAGNIISVAQEFVFTDAKGRTVPPGSLIRLMSSVMKVAASALISGEGAYTAHAYSVTPPSARADNTAWARASGDLSAYRGSIALGTPVAAGGTCYVKTQFSDVQDFEVIGNSLFLELVNAGTFVAAAVARQVFLYGFLV
ncbi:hypothetical protein [Bradyrhizobium sp. SEMIA]|uniref:hypothetical protein n=1 Tax=Bradyrhizobium sp. SEMIA TaxID=2597515 RepID=UPI0018A52242|nr:hypothetical protein [Bradyrhizobium sp. SEMIA]QOG20448.1 hypothetical protein FOM02_26945 [Bradyrhizobium sp. SEMIA]